MQENLYMKGHIRTISGIYVDILNPKPEMIDIYDIAHALSNMPRFGGHLPVFYSVAEHCLSVCDEVFERYQLGALLHDATEAYLLDMPSPIKKLLPDYQKLEDNFNRVIATKFNLEYPFNVQIKQADKFCLEWEWENIMLNGKENVKIYTPNKAKEMFIEKFIELTK